LGQENNQEEEIQVKEFVVVKRYTTYFTQTVMAEDLDDAITESAVGDWDLFDQEEEIYGSEAQ
jgi:hypothetical protein